MELEQCPFCGGKAGVKHQSGPYYTWITWVECGDCHAKSSPSLYGNNGTIKAEECSYEGREEAVKRVSALWNRRCTD